MRANILVITSLVIAACSTVQGPTPEGELFLERLRGTWGAVVDGKLDCKDSQTISFAADRTTAIFSSPYGFTNSKGSEVDTITYKILSIRDNAITMFLNGESRTTAGGDPIVWTLILFQPNAFVWRQTDWPVGHATTARMRCDA